MSGQIAREPARKLALGALCLAALALTGCMPAHRAPPALAGLDIPQGWTAPQHPTLSADTRIGAQWWRSFGDAALDRHVEAALARNTDLLLAGTRLDAALAQLRLAQSALGPTLRASAGGQADRTLGSSGVGTTRSIQPGVQISWEPDLWGRVRAQTSAAQLQLGATAADRDAVALSIAAATAQAYIGLLALEAQRVQTRDTVASRAEALRIAQDKVRAGYISQLQLTQAQSEYEVVLQALPRLEAAIARQYNALQLLTGELPGQRTPADAQSGQLAALRLPEVPVALPSDLLRRRPDLVQAELQLAASDATLGASRAAFLPQVALSASLGALYVNALNYNPVSVWSLGGSVLAPLFDQGRLSAQYESATAQRDGAAFAYRGAALTAFGEVENALVGVERLAQQMEHVTRRRAILARSVEFAKDRYEAGYAPYLEQLDAQRNLYQTEIEAITLRQEQLLNQLNLFKALGGGWAADRTAL